MQYTALYREWRPERFDTIVGQDIITKTLQSQIRSGKISHAYLFSGPRGTGKTSTAKVLARAVNCLSNEDGNPCGKCRTCIELASEGSMDVLEIDAASNNGVDEIRDLREKIHYPPATAKYRVYIIDEVHMLSMGAFNALLKTLEEPPNHAIFILATTELQKLPATILSRCQRYQFKRIPIKVIAERLELISQDKGIALQSAAASLIAFWAEGGLRDAISLLDQCLTVTGEAITEDSVLKVLGTATRQFVFSLADDLIDGNAPAILKKLNQLMDEGKDMRVFVKDFTNHMRSVMLAKYLDDCADLLGVEKQVAVAYRRQAERAVQERLIRTVEEFTLLEGKLRYAENPRILAEMTFLKICYPEDQPNLLALSERVSELEQKLSDLSAYGAKAVVDTAEVQQTTDEVAAEKQEQRPAKEKSTAPKRAEDVQYEEKKDSMPDEKDIWNRLLKDVKKESMPTYIMLQKASLQMRSTTAQVIFSPVDAIFAEAVKTQQNQAMLLSKIKAIAGDAVKLKVIIDQPETAPPEDAKRDEAEDAGEVERIKTLLEGEDIEFVVYEGDEEPPKTFLDELLD